MKRTVVVKSRLFGVPWHSEVYEDGVLVGAIVQGRFYLAPRKKASDV